MNRQTAPTDWKGSVMQTRIAKRYAAERRFKLLGLGAVLLSGAFLAFLLFVMVGNGARGFTYTHVAVPIDFKAMPLTIDTSRLGDADADQVIANAGLSDIVAFAADEALGNGGSDLISENAWKEVRSQIKDDPELLNGKTVFELPASSAVDIAAKEGAKGALGAKVIALENDGKLSTGIHWPFFKNADATDPAVAGIWGALKGSVLTIFIAFIIAFPTGVLAAIIVMLTLIGAFADRNSLSDVWIVVVFGVLAWVLDRYKIPIAPMVLGAVLGPMAEDSFTRSMITFHGDWTIFFKQPLSGSLMALALLSLAFPMMRNLFGRFSRAKAKPLNAT